MTQISILYAQTRAEEIYHYRGTRVRGE